MMKKEENEKLMQRYLEGKLNLAEEKGFENKLIDDFNIEDEELLYLKYQKFMSDTELEKFKEKLSQIHNKHYGSPSNILKDRRTIYGVAAAILILFSLSIYVLLPKKNNSFNAFDEFYQPLKDPGVLRNINTDCVLLGKGIHFYNKDAYQEAEESFKRFLEDKNKDCFIANLYLALCKIELNQLKSAKSILNKILEDESIFFKEKARWYLALIYLKDREIEKAKRILKTIRSNKGEYARKANLILSKI